MTPGERVALMAEIQKDERAFALLLSKMGDTEKSTGRYFNLGMTLDAFGDPRSWPEYSQSP